MIPHSLKIKGLYSYKAVQEIDFTNLTGAALFGIFGSVGSGKSSILEAIMFALYGDTERLNKSGDERYYNMTNLSSDDLLIDFVCLAGKDDNRYRFVVQGKRNSKNFRDVKVERKVYQWMQDNWMPIATDEVAEKVIGLSYENFRRTVIIPQGHFQEFIELKGRDRSEMMKVLFGLERFDLAEKNKRLSERNILALESLDGQLKGLGEATIEGIEKKEHDLLLKREISKSLEVELFNQRNEEKLYEELFKLFVHLKDTTQRLDMLNSRAGDFKIREERLRLYEKCVLNFKALLDQRAGKEREQALSNEEIKRNRALLVQKQARFNEVIVELDKVKPYYEKRDEYQEKAKELGVLISLRNLENDSKNILASIDRGTKLLTEKEQTIQALQEKKTLQEKHLEQRKEQILEQKIELKLDEELVHLKVQKSLQKFADALKDNIPCPLCGSVHHPEILSSSDDFDSKIHQVSSQKEALKTELEQAENSLKKLVAQIEFENKEKVDKFEKGLTKLNEQLAGIDGQKKSYFGQITIFKWEDYSNKRIEEIEEQRQKTEENYRKIIEKFTTLDTEHRGLDGQIKGLEGSQQTLLLSLEAHVKALVVISESIEAQLEIDGFETDSEVVGILKQNLMIDRERKEIQTFQTDLQATQQTLDQLMRDAKDKEYNAERHLAIKESIRLNEMRFNELKKEEGGLEKEIQSEKENLKTKQKLLIEKQRLEIRKDNLETLQKLFKANGFVDFVSSIYLKNLANAANERFHRMTRHQLHLEVNADNDFEVRDLLNGGKTRLLKTLSGGQKFQAALSLALALADNIHTRVQSRHNFFFLDEGFGSLDKESLQIVFETLKSLRKENRIVGIISHVEDLQQEIQTYLRIENGEDGSKVFSSW